MKLQSMWHDMKAKTLRPLALAGAAVAIMAASPFMAQAYDGGPGMAPPSHADRQLQQTYMKVGFSHRLQAMVADGKITKDQALKLQRLMDKEQDRQRRDHRRFVESLPEKTGISEDTLKELFAPPQRPNRDRDDDRYDAPRYGARHGHGDRYDD